MDYLGVDFCFDLNVREFPQTKSNPSVFKLSTGKDFVLLGLYLDNKIACTSTESLLDKAKLWKKNFKMTDLGRLEFLLEVKIKVKYIVAP